MDATDLPVNDERYQARAALLTVAPTGAANVALDAAPITVHRLLRQVMPEWGGGSRDVGLALLSVPTSALADDGGAAGLPPWASALGTFSQLAQQADLAGLVRRELEVVVVNADGDRVCEMGLREQGWRKVRTAKITQIPEASGPPNARVEPDQVEVGRATLTSQGEAIDAVKETELIMFDRLGGRTVQAVAKCLPRHGYAAFTRGYLDIPNPEVRDRVSFGNTPPNAQFWLEATAIRIYRATQADPMGKAPRAWFSTGTCSTDLRGGGGSRDVGALLVVYQRDLSEMGFTPTRDRYEAALAVVSP